MKRWRSSRRDTGSVRSVARADTFRKLMPEELRRLHWTGGVNVT